MFIIYFKYADIYNIRCVQEESFSYKSFLYSFVIMEVVLGELDNY